ncbi:MAG: type phosphodiesterase/nucleotide pyrophosphatase family protein [Phenylobacterium sp.]|nr:type phosphodiesterase/nucleotide pyrophosphatase family protein [Phenylobacterium sp.]
MIACIRLPALLIALALAALGGSPARARPAPATLTILVSIDGFRADYLQRGLTPNIAALAATGVRGEAMRPSYPSLTFPNHYTLVTGLRPDRSGIVDNNMEDPRKPGVRFTMSGVEISHDPFWWDEAEPLWVTAERAGVRTATMFWPGSDLPIRGVQPRDWKPYDKKFLGDQRVDQLLAWVARPAALRPRFATLYFDEVDAWGHNTGPDSPELNAALQRTDASIGRLVAGLKAHGLYARTNLVVVADHGMAPTSPERVVYVDDLLPKDGYRQITYGSSAGFEPGAEAEKALLQPHPHMACWRKGEMPERFHYGRNARVPAVVCLAQTGWLIQTRDGVKQHPVNKGAHGYDPDDPLMAALFVAHGPAFRKGAVQPAFDNVDIYPLLARLIGVTPQPNDGRLADLEPSLVR